jgi:hypothetical protein
VSSINYTNYHAFCDVHLAPAAAGRIAEQALIQNAAPLHLSLALLDFWKQLML